MNTQISDAITNKSILQFEYSDKPRTVQPHAFGVSKKGEDILRAYDALEHCWKLFTVSKMSELTVSEHSFYVAPGYKQGDSAMTTIHRQVLG